MKHASRKHKVVFCIFTSFGFISTLNAHRSDSGLSYTFFSVRPHYHLAMPERLTMERYDRMHVRKKECDGHGGFFAATLFGSRSSDKKCLAKHFMPFDKTSLLVQEGNDTNAPNRDLDAAHFGIITVNGATAPGPNDQLAFHSTITMCPRQSVIGLGFNLQYSLANCDGIGFWFGLATPLTRVKNKINLKETITDDGGGAATAAAATVPTDELPVANMIDAFKQDRWLFGKIDDGKKMTKTRLADIELRAGYNSVNTNRCRHGFYGSIILPTGNKPTAEFVFEPIVGHNRHFGVGFGTSSALRIWAECDRSVWVTFDTDTKYFFRNQQKRSFDLKFKPWSRYIQLYENLAEAQAANATAAIAQQFTPGINILTRDVCIRPGVATNLTTALIYNGCTYRVEGGYNFYARQGERIQLATAWEEGPAIKGRDGGGQTNVERTIDQQKDDNTPPVQLVASYDLSLITEEDLDLGSAAHPCAIAHIFYASIGRQWLECRTYPLFAGVGGSYEFSRSNTALDRWTIWGKFGLSF